MLNINIKLDFNERKFKREFYKATRETIRKKVASIRCPEHKQAARVEFQYNSGQNLDFDIVGCCQALVDRVTAQMK